MVDSDSVREWPFYGTKRLSKCIRYGKAPSVVQTRRQTVFGTEKRALRYGMLDVTSILLRDNTFVWKTQRYPDKSEEKCGESAEPTEFLFGSTASPHFPILIFMQIPVITHTAQLRRYDRLRSGSTRINLYFSL